MNGIEAVAISRPTRWDEPLDQAMSDCDVDWLRSREPFSSMDANAFPRNAPLEGILRYDCKMHRVQPGEIVVREGDYGNSAFLLINGTVQVVCESLNQEQLGRQQEKKLSWAESLRRLLMRSNIPESRKPHQVSANLARANTVRQVGDRQAIFLQDFDVILHDCETITLGPGELFGEVAAMYRSPRTATVVANSEAVLLEIRWQGLRIMRRDKSFADTLERHYREHWLPAHLREIPLLRYVPEANLQRVVDSTIINSYGRMEWNNDYKKTRKLSPDEQIKQEPRVAEEGSMPTELMVVRSGFGRMCKQHGDGVQTTAYLGKGHVFGLEEVAYNALRPPSSSPKMFAHSLHAVGMLDVLAIPIETFATEVLPHVRRSELPASVMQAVTEEKSAKDDRRKNSQRKSSTDNADKATSQGASFENTGLLEFILQNRLNNGQQAMVIDLHRCTRCDDCVKACASTHDGNPRFVRHGENYNRLQFVQACMQCEDPVCMIGCPTGAISRNSETGVVDIHESICVGCSTCANSCPYENIRMAEIYDPDGRAYCDASTGKPITKATKCDMCSSMPSGPACAAACPHDALVRIDLSDAKPLTKWLEQRS